MASSTIPASSVETLADLRHRLGDIPLSRILAQPFPGTATEKDLLARKPADRKLCELVDGVLVEKAMGTREALLATLIVHYIWDFLEANDLGIALGADGAIRLRLGLIRIPDAMFISWERLPEGELPDEAIASVIPDLAIEVLNPGNTTKEIQRKLTEYFKAGVRLVWVVDRKKQQVEVFHSPTESHRLHRNQTLQGENVLPDFSLPLQKLFAPRRRKTRNQKPERKTW